MWFKKKLTLKELILGIVLAFLSYILIAVFNISNEDLYNWDVSLIFSQGRFLDIAAIIAFWLWCVILVGWMASVAFRMIKVIFNEK